MRPLLNINITATEPDRKRFRSREDLRQFYRGKGMDGMELMLCGAGEIPELFPPEDIMGLHLRYYHCWFDFWNADTQALDREFLDPMSWEQFYGGTTREAFLAGWRQELEIARKAGVRYVVFHIAECTLEESLTYRFRHTDEEICAAACEIINALLDGQDYDFWFLVENLWWSGLTMTRPEITAMVMDGIHYEKKGIMLDTGHLLNTNPSLRTQEEGIEYIGQVLERNGSLCRYIKGIHLNQSLSGAYVERTLADPPRLTGNYWQRMGQIFPHIYSIDYHKPFTAPGVAALLRRIQPEFVTVELITGDRAEHEAGLLDQMKALTENGGLEWER